MQELHSQCYCLAQVFTVVLSLQDSNVRLETTATARNPLMYQTLHVACKIFQTHTMTIICQTYADVSVNKNTNLFKVSWNL